MFILGTTLLGATVICYRLTLCTNSAQDFFFNLRTTQLRVVWRTVYSVMLY